MLTTFVSLSIFDLMPSIWRKYYRKSLVKTSLNKQFEMWKWTQSDLSLMQNSMITEVVNFTQFRASVLDHALLISYVDGISFVRERLKVFYRARNYCTPKRNLPLIRRDVNWNQKQQALELLIDAPYFPLWSGFSGNSKSIMLLFTAVVILGEYNLLWFSRIGAF